MLFTLLSAIGCNKTRLYFSNNGCNCPIKEFISKYGEYIDTIEHEE